jgi:uncharacterized protein YegL
MEDIKTNKTLVNVVLDRSGSMQTTRDETISGYNAYLDTLRKDDKIEYFITLIQFDSPVGSKELTIKYVDKPLAEVPVLTKEEYIPRGLTPLYDAIGECVRQVETKDRAVITVIITDGYENASQEFTKDAIKALISSKEKDEHWTFAFLGADVDSYAVGGGLGVGVGNTTNYAKGMEREAYTVLARSTMMRSETARTVGVAGASLRAMFNDSDRQEMGDDLSQKPTATVTPDAPISKPTSIPSRRNWKTSK